MAKFQLVVLPFAGGNEYSYSKFEPYLSPDIEIVTMELPGKGSRIQEPLLDDLEAIVSEIGGQCINKINKPFAIYGHSMGALVGHLLIHYLQEMGFDEPLHFFASSYFAPSHHHDKRRGQFNDEQFINHLKVLNGLPPALLNEPKLLSIFLPILRADIHAMDNFRYFQGDTHQIPVTVFTGNEEKIIQANIREWKETTEAPIKFFRLDGDHFFILTATEQLCNFIKRDLMVYELN